MIGLLKALGTTFSTMARKPVTIQYPTERRPIFHRTRGFPVLFWDQEVEEPYCVGCQRCARACPTGCMSVTMKDNPLFKGGKSKRRKIVDEFFIDYGRCMRCNICVEVCPFEAIALDNTWASIEGSRYDRFDLVKDLEGLLALSKSGHFDPFEGTSARKKEEKVAVASSPSPQGPSA